MQNYLIVKKWNFFAILPQIILKRHFNDEVYDIIILQHSRKQNCFCLQSHFLMNAHHGLDTEEKMTKDPHLFIFLYGRWAKMTKDEDLWSSSHLFIFLYKKWLKVVIFAHLLSFQVQNSLPKIFLMNILMSFNLKSKFN